ncbi:hypothetical protein EB093_03215 [bacterium]|nr:hypothetical protein [bacterium]
MSINLGQRAGWKHNWGQAGNTGSGGQGRRNHYMGSANGSSEPSNQPEPPIDSMSTFSPTYHPFDPRSIKQVNVGDILEKSSEVGAPVDSLDQLIASIDPNRSV